MVWYSLSVMQVTVQFGKLVFIRRKEFIGKISLSQKFGHIECLKLGLGAIGKRVNENTGSRRR